MSKITRDVLVDDDGTFELGSDLDDARWQILQSIIESVAGDVKWLAGDPAEAVTQTSYPSGATFDKLHPGTAVWVKDSQYLHGTYKLRGHGRAQSGTTITVGLFNLSDGSPDTALVEMTFTSTTGAVNLTGAITFASGGSEKTYGIKVKVDTGEGFVWGLSIERTGA